MARRKNTIDDVMKKVVITPGCWLWTGCVVKKTGYGKVNFDGRRHLLAHRVVYECFKTKIPDGLQIDHLCKVRRCVNPDHLEAVTAAENLARSDTASTINSKKVVCIRGHALSGDNLYVCSRGKRQCRTCARTVWKKRKVA